MLTIVVILNPLGQLCRQSFVCSITSCLYLVLALPLASLTSCFHIYLMDEIREAFSISRCLHRTVIDLLGINNRSAIHGAQRLVPLVNAYQILLVVKEVVIVENVLLQVLLPLELAEQRPSMVMLVTAHLLDDVVGVLLEGLLKVTLHLLESVQIMELVGPNMSDELRYILVLRGAIVGLSACSGPPKRVSLDPTEGSCGSICPDRVGMLLNLTVWL